MNSRKEVLQKTRVFVIIFETNFKTLVSRQVNRNFDENRWTGSTRTTMDKIQLKAENRDSKTAKPNQLRREGKVPAVLYGHNVPNMALTVSLGEFEKALKKAGESTIVDLVTADGKTHPVLIHEIQSHYLTSKPIHVDFYEVSMTEKLKTAITLEFTGESQAVKALGGTLVKVLDAVQVECLPADLPHSLTVDISALNTFQDVIKVVDIKVPAKVTVLTPAEEVVAKVQPPRDVEAELATPVVEDVSKVEGAAETPAPTAEGEVKEEAKA